MNESIWLPELNGCNWLKPACVKHHKLPVLSLAPVPRPQIPWSVFLQRDLADHSNGQLVKGYLPKLKPLQVHLASPLHHQVVRSEKFATNKFRRKTRENLWFK